MARNSVNNRPARPMGGSRSRNLDLLLSAIWEHAPVSRTGLSRLTGLAPSTITRLVRELEAAGLIRDAGKGESSGGRQPVLITPNPAAGLIVSIDMSGSRIRGGVFDAANHLHLGIEQPYGELGARAIKEQLLDLAHGMLSRVDQDYPLLAIGISVPGSMDAESGVVHEAYNLKLRNFPLRQILMEEFDLPVYMEVDVYAGALAEKYYGAGQNVDDLVYVLLSTGVGVGIIVDGRIYQGKAGMAGYLGHIIIDRNGPLCLCGKRGCLEAIAGRPALVNSARRLLKYARDPILSEVVVRDDAPLALKHVARAARESSQFCQELIRGQANDTAYAISTITTILDIDFVIIGGEVAEQLGDLFFQELHRAMKQYRREQHPVSVVPAQLERDGFLRGISMLTLYDMLGVHFPANG